jgi:uncharacterized membrane protein
LLIAGVAGNIVIRIIPFVGWLLLPIFSFLIFIAAVMGIVNTLNGKANELPVIGKFELIK